MDASFDLITGPFTKWAVSKTEASKQMLDVPNKEKYENIKQLHLTSG